MSSFRFKLSSPNRVRARSKRVVRERSSKLSRSTNCEAVCGCSGGCTSRCNMRLRDQQESVAAGNEVSPCRPTHVPTCSNHGVLACAPFASCVVAAVRVALRVAIRKKD